jgi:hypothetical protein
MASTRPPSSRFSLRAPKDPVERRAMSDRPTVHRSPVKHEGAFVNAYLVETASGAIAVDAL